MKLTGPKAMTPRHATLQEALHAAGQGSAELVFVDIHERETRVPWREVRHRARRIAATLIRRGIHAGDRVALILPTGVDFTDMFFGVLLAGAVPMPVAPPKRLGRIDEYSATTVRALLAAQVRMLITEERLGPLLSLITEKCPAVTKVDIEALHGSRSSEESELRASSEALALIQLSSGSTLEPKPIALSHRCLLAHAAAFDAALREPSESAAPIFVSWLPLFHDVGLLGTLLAALYAETKLVLFSEDMFLTRPVLWLRAISRHKATVSAAPISSYAIAQRRIQDDQLEKVDLSTWRHALTVSEPTSRGFAQAFLERFARYGFGAEALRPVYGLAEAAFGVTLAPPGRPLRTRSVDPLLLAQEGKVAPGARELVSVGTPLAGVEVEIRGPRSDGLPELQSGQVHVRSPMIMGGYAGNEEETARVLRDGWLDTGDVGFIADGELFVHGRVKDLIIVGGVHRSPHEFEDVLEQLPGIRMASSIAAGFVPSGSDREELLILVEQSQTPDAKLEQHIQELLKASTGVEPHTVVLLSRGGLPRTSSGKLRRAEAVRRYLAGELAVTPPKGVLTAAIEGVRFGFVRAKQTWKKKS